MIGLPTNGAKPFWFATPEEFVERREALGWCEVRVLRSVDEMVDAMALDALAWIREAVAKAYADIELATYEGYAAGLMGDA